MIATSLFTVRRPAAVAAALALLMVSGVRGQVLLLDNFDDTNGPLAAVGDGVVDVSTYRAAFDDGSDFVGRTQFRFSLPAENVPTAAPGSSDGKVAVLELSTHNMLDPGNSFLGTDMITKRNFARAGGLRMTTRMRVDGPAAAQGGMVAAAFLYDVQRENTPGDLVRDEIDHEILTNISAGPVPHDTLTNVWTDGNFASPGTGAFIDNPAGFDVREFHDYRTDWTPTSVKWYIDDVLVRTETQAVPEDPMRAHWNLWAPDSTFAAAFNAAFNPAESAPGTTYRMELDSVQIERLNTVRGPNLLVDPSFENLTAVSGGIGGWQLFNNASFNGIELTPQDGDIALKTFGPFSGGPNASGAFQNVPATPGQEFEATVWAYAPSSDPIMGQENYTALTLQFANADNQVIGSVNFSPGANQKETPIYDGRDTRMIEDEWVQYVVNGIAPAGTAYARINLFFIQLNSQGGAVWFDNVELYELIGTEPRPNADFNGDFAVDGEDFLAWQRGFGSGTTRPQGDSNGDAVVNAQDYANWRLQYGSQQPNPAPGATIPEPTTAALVAALALGWASRRRAR